MTTTEKPTNTDIAVGLVTIWLVGAVVLGLMIGIAMYAETIANIVEPFMAIAVPIFMFIAVPLVIGSVIVFAYLHG